MFLLANITEHLECFKTCVRITSVQNTKLSMFATYMDMLTIVIKWLHHPVPHLVFVYSILEAS